MQITAIVLIASSLGVDQTHRPPPAATSSPLTPIERKAFRQLGQGWTTGSGSTGPSRYAGADGIAAGQSAEPSAVAGQSGATAGNGSQTGRLIERPNYGQLAETEPAGGTTGSVAPPQLVIPPSSDPYGQAAASTNLQNGSRQFSAMDPGRNPFDSLDSNTSGPMLTGDYGSQSNSARPGSGSVLKNGTSAHVPDQSNSDLVPVGPVRGGNVADRQNFGGSTSPLGSGTLGDAANGNRNPRYVNEQSPVLDDREPRRGGLEAWSGALASDNKNPSPGTSAAGSPNLGTYRDSNRSDSHQSNRTNAGYTPQDSAQARLDHPPEIDSRNTRSSEETSTDNRPTPQWTPLIMTAVALMGSLGANLFLGFSYLDARHKYLSAVRRGARSFARNDVTL